MPSMSGGALRPCCQTAPPGQAAVSMPSMSGGALRPIRHERTECWQQRVSMPSMSGGALRRSTSSVSGSPSRVSMPSMSGGALRPAPSITITLAIVSMPSIRAGLRPPKIPASRSGPVVSMPSMSGGALRRRETDLRRPGLPDVSMPSMSGGALRLNFLMEGWYDQRFYALDVGRGFATRHRCRLRPPHNVSMPSMSGGALRLHSRIPRTIGAFMVSMPSMSGGALRPGASAMGKPRHRQFLCPRCRAGLCNGGLVGQVYRSTFLCPRCRAGLCDVVRLARSLRMFLCPRCRAGLCDNRMSTSHCASGFYALDVGRGFATSSTAVAGREHDGFYALDVGRGFATTTSTHATHWHAAFLCPRCRAGLCDCETFRRNACTHVCFYALDVGRGFATRDVMTLTCGMAVTFLCPRCRAGLCDDLRVR